MNDPIADIRKALDAARIWAGYAPDILTRAKKALKHIEELNNKNALLEEKLINLKKLLQDYDVSIAVNSEGVALFKVQKDGYIIGERTECVTDVGYFAKLVETAFGRAAAITATGDE